MPASFGASLGTYTNDPNPGGLSFTITTTGAVASGGRVFVETGFFGVATGTTITVSGGGLTWTTHTKIITGGAWGEAFASAPAPAGLASGTVLTVTFSASTTFCLGGAWWMADSGVFDLAVSQTTALNASFQWSTGSLTPAVNGYVVGGGMRGGAAGAGTPRTNYLESNDYVEGNSNSSHQSVYRLGTTASTPYTDIGGAWTSSGTFWAAGGSFADATAAVVASAVGDPQIQWMDFGPGDFGPAPFTDNTQFATGTSVSVVDLTLTPGTPNVAWTGSTPAVKTDLSLAPAAPNVTWTGSTPAVKVDIARTPGTPNVDWAGSTTAVNRDTVLVPGTPTVAWTGSTPAFVAGQTLTPGTPNVDWSGSTPTLLTDSTLLPGAPNVAWQGSTPALKLDRVLGPSTPNVAWAGSTSSVLADASRSPGAAEVVWSGSTPSVILEGLVTLVPGTATVTWTGSSPALLVVPDVVEVEEPPTQGGRYEPIGDDEDVTTQEVRNLTLKPGTAVVAWTGSRPGVRVELAPLRFRLPLRRRPVASPAPPEAPRVVDRALVPRAGSVAYAGSRPRLVIESYVPESAYERALARIAELEDQIEEEAAVFAALSAT